MRVKERKGELAPAKALPRLAVDAGNEREFFMKALEVYDALRLIEGGRLFSGEGRLSAKILRLSLEKAVLDVKEKARANPAKREKVFGEGLELVSGGIEERLRGLVVDELVGKAFTSLPARCGALFSEERFDWVPAEARGISGKIKGRAYLLFAAGFERGGDKSPVSTGALVEAAKYAVKCHERVGELEWVARYRGPELSKERLKRAESLVARFSRDGVLELDGSASERRLLGALSYAAIGEWDLRKVPKSLREDAMRFRFAIKSRQLDERECAEAAREYVTFPKKGDLRDLVEAYAPLKEGDVLPVAARILSFMAKAASVKAEAMEAHPMRAASWFMQLKGRVTEWESPAVGRVDGRRLMDYRLSQLETDYVWVQAILQFNAQEAKLRKFAKEYGEGLDEGGKRIIAEIIGRDPLNGEALVREDAELEKYLGSLDRTLARWKDLSKEFRKVPYNLERALRERYGQGAGAGENQVVEEQLFALKRDVEEQLRQVYNHTKAGKALYRMAMEMRKNYLGDALPERKRKRIPKR